MRAFGLAGLWVRSLLLGPLGFVVCLAVLFVVVRWYRRRKGRAVAGRCGIVWLAVFAGLFLLTCMPYPAFLLERPLMHWSRSIANAHRLPETGTNSEQGPLFILVLGGGVADDSMLNSTSLSRIERGLQIWRRYPDAYVCFSEGRLGTEGVAWLQTFLECRGLPANRIKVESKALSTHENLVYSTDLINDLGVRRVILVTHERHVPRAFLSARHSGLEPAVAAVEQHATLTFCPQWDALQYGSSVLNEYMGLIGYALIGWL